MATAEVTLDTAGAVRYAVRPSLVMELVWALMIHDGEPDPANFPIRAERFVGAPEVEERLASFWDDGQSCMTELFVIADRGGVVFEEDPERLWRGLEEGAQAEPRFEPLQSETPRDQEIFRSRITRLREDPDLRRDWLELLRSAWGVLEGSWHQGGRPAVDAFARDLRGRLTSHGSYGDLESIIKCDLDGLLPRLVREYSAAGLEVVVSPAWYGRQSFVLSLPDVLLVGPSVPPRQSGPSAEARGRARRLKAIGDPTRLAMLEATAVRAMTVGELASDMGVAQPTISNHVRILRDAGLLVPDAASPRRLRPDSGALGHLFEETLGAIT
jgi:Bacterial regulatory protein, arsR family